MGVLAAAGIGAAGSIIGGALSSRSANKSAEQALQLERERLAQELEQRREDIDRAFAGNEAGITADFNQLQRDLALLGTPSERARAVADLQAQLDPAVQAGNQQVLDIFSGRTLADEQAALDPVLQARSQAAQAQRDAINQSLLDTQAQIRGRQASQGFVGGSSFQNQLLNRANLGATQQAAGVLGTANFQNALARQQLQQGDINRRIGSLNLPFQRAAAFGEASLLPERVGADSFSTRLTPLNDIFRIKTEHVSGVDPSIGAKPGYGGLVSGIGQVANQWAGIGMQNGGTFQGLFGSPQNQPGVVGTAQNTTGVLALPSNLGPGEQYMMSPPASTSPAATGSRYYNNF